MCSSATKALITLLCLYLLQNSLPHNSLSWQKSVAKTQLKSYFISGVKLGNGKLEKSIQL